MAARMKHGQEKAEEIGKLKQELIDLKQKAQADKKKLADYYVQQIKELEEKFQKKVGEIGQIHLELESIKEFRREMAAVEKELEDIRPEEFVDKKQIMMAETTQCETVLQLNSPGRDVFKENVGLHGAFSYQLKETMELQKINQKLEEDKTLLLQEKGNNPV